jgi:hypothetical protein
MSSRTSRAHFVFVHPTPEENMLHRWKKVDSPMSDAELAVLKHGHPVWDKSGDEVVLVYFDKQKNEFVTHEEFVARQKKYAEARRATYLHGHRSGRARRNSFFLHS